MVDLQKICSLVIGHSLNGLLFGEPFSKDETLCSRWLTNEIFSFGIDNENTEIEALEELSYSAISESSQPLLATVDKLPSHLQKICRLALNLPHQYDEACALPQDNIPDENVFFQKFMETVETESWELEDEKRVIDIVTRCVLTTLLKHTNMLKKSPMDSSVHEVFRFVHILRNKLFNKMCNVDCKNAEQIVYDEKDHDTSNNTINDLTTIDNCEEEFNFKKCSQDILQRCLFLLLFVKGKSVMCIFTVKTFRTTHYFVEMTKKYQEQKFFEQRI